MQIVKELALGLVTCVLILGFALASNALLDRYLFGDSACVDARGSWTNWSWPNVPTLSPPCPNATPEPREPAGKI